MNTKAKKLFHRYLTLIVSLVMVATIALSQPLVNVFAEDTEPESGPFGTVPIPDELDPGQIEASKEVSDNGDGTYTVTMKMQGTPYSVWEEDADYILLIDTSNSMAKYLESGNTRLEVVREAALNAISTITANPNNRISLITFNRTATVRNELTNTAVSQSETALQNLLDKSLTLSLGTNQQDAFRKAGNVLNRGGNAKNGDRSAYVILLTDGLPTVHYSNNTNTTLIGNGSANDKNLNRATAIRTTVNQALSLKANYNASIYNFGLDITGDEESGEDKMAVAESFLKSPVLGSDDETYWSDCVMTADAAEFSVAFNEIIYRLTSTYEAGDAVLTDVIDDGFVFERIVSVDGTASCDDDKTVVWDAGTATSATKMLVFTVRLVAEYEDEPTATNTYYTNVKDSDTVTLERTVRENNPYYDETEIKSDVPGNFKVVLESNILTLEFTKDIALGFGVNYETATFQFAAYRDETCTDIGRLATFAFDYVDDGLSKDLVVNLPKSVLGDAYDDLLNIGAVYLKEVTAADDNWEYDTNVYKYTFEEISGVLTVTGIELLGGDGTPLDEAPTFTNTYLPVATLTVSKQVSDDASTSLDFAFTVEILGDGTTAYGYTKYLPEGGATTGTIAQGGTFTLKANEMIVIAGLPVDSDYQITENLMGALYKYYQEENDGIYSGSVADNDVTVVSFKNHFPVNSDITIQLDKAVIPAVIEVGETGDYTLAITNTCDYPLYLQLEDSLYNSMHSDLIAGSLQAELDGNTIYVKENMETFDDSTIYYMTFFTDSGYADELLLDPDEVLYVYYSITFSEVGEYDNTAGVTGAYDYVIGDHTDHIYAYDDDNAVVEVVDPEVSVEIEKEVSVSEITAGEYAGYTLLITNTCDYPLALSVYDDKLDSMYGSVSRLQASYQGTDITVNVSPDRLLTFTVTSTGDEFLLPAGKTLEVTYRILFDTIGTYTNAASVKGVYTREVDGQKFSAIDEDEEAIVVTKTPENPVFTKRPAIQFVSIDDSVDYIVRGFGNDKGEAMDSMSVTDIIPEGIEFRSAKVPAMRLGEGVYYSVLYKTNLSSEFTLLYDKVSADEAFTFTMPVLSAGSHITEVMLTFESVPEGFALGDEIVFTFEVVSDPGTGEIINKANMSYTINGETITIEDEGVPLGSTDSGFGAGTPQTGDTFHTVWYYIVLFGIAALGIGCSAAVRLKRTKADRK